MNLNQKRINYKKAIIQGLDPSSSYSSDFDDPDPHDLSNNANQIQNQIPQQIPIVGARDYRYNDEVSQGAIETVEAHDQFEGLSKETKRLLKTRDTFDYPEKRVLAIWSNLYEKP